MPGPHPCRALAEIANFLSTCQPCLAQHVAVTMKALKHIIPLGLLLAMSIAVMTSRHSSPSSENHASGEPGQIEFDPSRILVRPFYTQGNQVALALHGGALPADRGKVPSIVIGTNILRMVHLAWVHDWTYPECVATFNRLRLLYESEEGASLPALRIYLNPIYADEAGEAVHRALLRAFFHSENRGCYLQLSHDIAAGMVAPNAQAIRSHIENIDPALIDDWETPFGWLEDDIDLTFAIARTQRDHNAAILHQDHPNQLTSMLTVLPASADSQGIISFIQEANATQNAWLLTLSPPPLQPSTNR